MEVKMLCQMHMPTPDRERDCNVDCGFLAFGAMAESTPRLVCRW